jgi:hypothetical protein
MGVGGGEIRQGILSCLQFTTKSGDQSLWTKIGFILHASTSTCYPIEVAAKAAPKKKKKKEKRKKKRKG